MALTRQRHLLEQRKSEMEMEGRQVTVWNLVFFDEISGKIERVTIWEKEVQMGTQSDVKSSSSERAQSSDVKSGIEAVPMEVIVEETIEDKVDEDNRSE